MALFILKPIFWNTANYQRPSGWHGNAGFPKKHGYGHEEWNNAPIMGFQKGGVVCRAFHTEGVGNAPVEEEAGAIFVFMYASHDGVQQLVGIAGGATSLISAHHRPSRETMAEDLRLNRLSKEAWAVPSVQEAYNKDRGEFDSVWSRNLHWIPNWYCPAETYMWLDKPVTLDAMQITGKARLIGMFSSYANVTVNQAISVMKQIPAAQRTPIWHRIFASIRGEDHRNTEEDVLQTEKRRDISSTTRQRLIDARLGQGQFRRDLDQRWGGACAVSGCTVRAVLKASHIKPWAASTDNERLDPANGLLLTANLDALFDRGLVSFDGSGEMLVSRQLSEMDQNALHLPRALSLRKPLDSEQECYMAYHREQYGY